MTGTGLVSTDPPPYNLPMHRRDVLKSLAAAAALPALTASDLVAQTTDFTPAQIATLRALAEVVLPLSLGADGRDDAVRRFVAWVRGYKPGAIAATATATRSCRRPPGRRRRRGIRRSSTRWTPPPKARGAATFAALTPVARRAVVESALNDSQRVTQMPARPNGANLVADFMGLYFNGADARDIAYNAAIGRDTCRGLDGSEKAPPPLKAR